MGTGLVILESSLVHIVHAGLPNGAVSEIVHKLSNIKFITPCLPLHRNPAYEMPTRAAYEYSRYNRDSWPAIYRALLARSCGLRDRQYMIVQNA